jgi:hypothetical protein
MGIAALVVDVGAWYLRADKIQRAADAAALAGVVFLPGSEATAISTADNTAVKNGVPEADVLAGDVKVDTWKTDPSLNMHQLKVSITDPDVPTFFAKVFGLDSITETRSSTAEYQPPVPLGSAENSFGTGGLSLDPEGDTSNIWAAVNGYCTSKENGDEFLSAFDGTYDQSTGQYECSATVTPETPHATTNFEYNGDKGSAAGYSYNVVTGTDPLGSTTQAIQVDAYDPAYEPTQCPGAPGGQFPPGGGQSPDLGLAGGQTITTDYHLTYAPVPLDPSMDSIPSGSLAFSIGPTSGPPNDVLGNEYVATSAATNSCGQWVNLFTIPPNSPDGEYRLQVSTLADEPNSNGSNAYGLRVYQGTEGTWARCSTITTSTTWDNTLGLEGKCPVIQGQNALSVYANQANSTGQFYLAQIDQSYAGHNLEVTLFDPGEGDKDIKLIDPDGNPVNIIWQTTDDCGMSPPTPFTAPPTSSDCAEDLGFTHRSTQTDPPPPPGCSCLEVDGSIDAPAGFASGSEFNDRHVTLAFPIPANYTADNGGWWKIQYDSTGAVTDRTTWSISLSGSPIHLIPSP